jgi:hypothetical protein
MQTSARRARGTVVIPRQKSIKDVLRILREANTCRMELETTPEQERASNHASLIRELFVLSSDAINLLEALNDDHLPKLPREAK